MVIEDQRQQESNKEMDRCTPLIVLIATYHCDFKIRLRVLAEIFKLHLKRVPN